MTHRWILKWLLVGAASLLAARAYTHSDGPPIGATGAPADNGRTCNQSGCHRGNPTDDGDGSITIGGVPDAYVPGAKYSLTIQVQKPGQSRWGFELTATNATNHRAGQFAITDRTHTKLAGSSLTSTTATSPVYVEQTTSGTFAGQEDAGPVLSFDWTAPASGAGTVTFYAAGNAANNNGQDSGDYIYTTSAASTEGAPVAPVVYGDLNGDGQVNIVDATMALQFAVGLKQPTPDQLVAGDVTPVPGTGVAAGRPFGDGKITLSDVTRILQRAVGLAPGTFP